MSSEFEQLSEGVKRWVFSQGWENLRDVQRRSIPAVLSGTKDLLITAPTAGGKTEAAFLPAISWAEKHKPDNSYSILSISPLKALINDQCMRLTSLCGSANVNITPWHGDVSRSIKMMSWKNPSGLLLITPESFEGLLIRSPEVVRRRLQKLQYVIIDEYHSFLGSNRGYQLISQLNRLEALLGRKVCRIGLSATIGSSESALKFLRTGSARESLHINSEPPGKQLQINLSGYAPRDRKAIPLIAQELWEKLRGSNNLVFTGSRSMVEILTNTMSGYCDSNRLPNEFFAHHGSMNRLQRETLEERLRSDKLPTTAIATSTLELGIDLGGISSVAYVGAPCSVSSLRQQLGRSGRRGRPSILRVLVPSNAFGKDANAIEALSLGLFQAIAVVELMLTRWYEPTDVAKYELSTIVQQIMALAAQYRGLTIGQFYNILCEKGPWTILTPDLFIEILKSLSVSEIISQSDSSGELMLGVTGERIVNDRTFATSFAVPEQFSLVYNGKEIGRIPIEDNFLSVGQGILFGGNSWKIIEVSQPDHVIQLERSKAGVPPSFSGTGPPVHTTIRLKVEEFYQSSYIPDYLDNEATQLVEYGRQAYADLDLNRQPIQLNKNHLCWVVFASTQVVNTLCAALAWLDFEVIRGDPVIYIDLDPDEPDVVEPRELINAVYEIISSATEDGLIAIMPPLELGKYDYLLSAKLRQRAYCAELTDRDATIDYLSRLTRH